MVSECRSRPGCRLGA
ncbi:hypothetical protein MTR67_050948 [Solanum verrucosum]|uniref:Uncharacterized protein n=1 Tax=Solanum verrucosum TaxID=315347 RepID=A0AAF0V2E5_SOLVR|nr:hypothetical protein MTR67_050948 [Solanum verrucosum]